MRASHDKIDLHFGVFFFFASLSQMKKKYILSFIPFYLDVDECKNPSVRCGTNFRCQDLPNSHTCICDGGYRLSGKDCKGKPHNLSSFSCEDIPKRFSVISMRKKT